ncbi:ketopantoate reductase family protein [Candidatus Poribacteria bacterium]|nr:ketopantoate reductase family protein [Candidatus Poribacteria bacterium]MBT5535687.1 ketopantoate reductase family protein [Candidatus Poribacteria bacterium]MBT5712463.1 ketopantoate reductase family protein [Candidatus Poribacteria bacterium]MBT7101194.1 ketopantoate reductase family protein [Candidatus Poribacteria bacterium]MBT7808263.1 ketopantoate reductase family protein [Candidatus Poribacteria bacterium]
MTSCVIVGPGAIGLLFACRLAPVLPEIALLDHRPDRAARLTESGIRLATDAETTTHRIGVYPTARDVPFAPECVLFTTKAYATSTAAEHARPLGRSARSVVSLQNGIGNVEALANVFGRERCIAGTTAEGATLVGEGSVRHAGDGVTRLAAVSHESAAATRDIARTLTEAGFATEVSGDWEGVVWAKALVNSAINPLTALVGVRNGHFAASASGRELVTRIATEGSAAAAEAGISVPPDMAATSLAVCEATATNISSMRQDFERGTRSELDEISGIIVDRAKRAGVQAPALSAVTLLARAKSAATRG